MYALAVEISTWRRRGLSKWAISRVMSTLNGVTLTITLRISDLLSRLGFQVGFADHGTSRLRL